MMKKAADSADNRPSSSLCDLLHMLETYCLFSLTVNSGRPGALQRKCSPSRTARVLLVETGIGAVLPSCGVVTAAFHPLCCVDPAAERPPPVEEPPRCSSLSWTAGCCSCYQSTARLHKAKDTVNSS